MLNNTEPTPILDPQSIKTLGLEEKDLIVYTHLIRLGTAPLRKIALETGINRGTTYDALKRLQSAGLVGFVDAKRHRYFTAEDPQKLRGFVTKRELALQTARQKLEEWIPSLSQMKGTAEYRPAVRFFEGKRGVKEILEDVLLTTKRQKQPLYRVYSSSDIRDLVLSAWPSFTETRKKAGVKVRTIAIGAGGTTVGLDERKWLTKDGTAPTYIFIYGDKTAYISKDKNDVFGAVIEDPAITATQKVIFDQLFQVLD